MHNLQPNYIAWIMTESGCHSHPMVGRATLPYLSTVVYSNRIQEVLSHLFLTLVVNPNE